MMRRLCFMRVSFEIPSGIVRNSLLWFCGLQQRFFSADGMSAVQKYFCQIMSSDSLKNQSNKSSIVTSLFTMPLCWPSATPNVVTIRLIFSAKEVFFFEI